MDRASVQERFGIIGVSAALHHVIDQIRLVARTDVNVLIQGESGVGKEVIAKAIHAMSRRRHKPLVIVNCGAIPEGLIESELFGAEKGAFTGAVERRSGHFEEADGGTIFLDEIGEMPLAAQVRLLRVLETGEYSRVGSSTLRKTDARVIAATNKDLAAEVRAGRFREDLYYRLSIVEIKVPPLRERPEDILPLLDAFLHEFAQRYNTPAKTLTPEARQMLVRYRWPGNVRELKNLAQQIVVLIPKTEIDVDDIRPYMRGVTASGVSGGLVVSSSGREGGADGWSSSTEARERELIYRALLELRNEIHELRDELRDMIVRPRRHATPDGVREERFAPHESPIFFEPIDSSKPLLPPVEDASYELAGADDDDESETEGGGGASNGRRAFPTLQDAEQQLIVEALKHFNGNRRQTARALGISERTLYRKLKEIDAS